MNPLDPPLTPDELANVARLTPSDIEKIDKHLLSNTISQWRKTARVVAEAMSHLKQEFPAVPDIFNGQRVMALAEKGLVESQGNLQRMRYSEIRLPQSAR